MDHYRYFREAGIDVDILHGKEEIGDYSLVIVPMLYMLHPGTAERIKNYVAKGGTILATYMTGIVNENDLVFLGDLPAEGLKEVFGIRREEIDALYDGQENLLQGFGEKDYTITELCELIHLEGAEALATYGADWYEGRPALTKNKYGEGTAYYLAAKTGTDFLRDFYNELSEEIGLNPNAWKLPEGVYKTSRTGEYLFHFLQNFTDKEQVVETPYELLDLENEESASTWKLKPYEVRILREEKK